MALVGESSDLAKFQLEVAKRWQARGHRCTDPFGRFCFYFAGFNALYFLWKILDGSRATGGRTPSEKTQVQNLVAKFDEGSCDQLVHDLRPQLSYFADREPIQRMDKRTLVSPFRGTITEGDEHRRDLGHSNSRERVRALASIIYLVRCNLVHGSKGDSGDDKTIVVNAVPVVAGILQAAIAVTDRAVHGG